MDESEENDVVNPYAKKLGIPRDMLIFFIGEGLCLLGAVLYYKFLPPQKVGVTARHVVALVLGIAVGFFSFGWQFNHVFAQSICCFLALQVLPRSFMHIGVFVMAMGYLISLHLYRAYAIPEDVLYSIDVSGPLMIVTQKITSIAFSIHDGRHGNKDKLSDLQKRYMISKPPSLLEYFSYIFHFQAVVVGPLSFYKDYIAYVEGTDVSCKGDTNGMQNNNNIKTTRPSPFHSVCYKLCISMCWMAFHFTMKPLYPELHNSDPEFIRSHGILYRGWYMVFSMLCSRAKYYVAFTLGDAICNASGLGFNGYDSKGRAKWDLITNVNVLGIELATSAKVYIDNWNIQTAIWLRLVCYDRVPVQKRFATFLLSALWHGCYAGYYFTFITGVAFSEVGRKIRRKIRPHFQRSRHMQIVYDILTWMGTHITIAYMVVPFTVLHWNQTVIFYTMNCYWSVHILCAILFFILSYLPTPKNENVCLETDKPEDKKNAANRTSLPVNHSVKENEPKSLKFE